MKFFDNLYSKVKAQAVGGTLGGVVSGAILWIVEAGTGEAPDASVTGLVVGGSAVVLGLIFGRQTYETHAPGPKQK